jgi:L-arabinose isomerase
MIYPQLETWFVVGSQHLYGPKTLQQVADNAEQIVAGLNAEGTPADQGSCSSPRSPRQRRILALCRKPTTPRCAGLVTWMHTFSPARCGSPG